jgi:hypothetical protein
VTTADKVLRLFANSTVTQGTLSILVVGGWIYMMVNMIPIPTSMEIVVGAVVGFFFGSKTQAGIRAIQDKMDEQREV